MNTVEKINEQEVGEEIKPHAVQSLRPEKGIILDLARLPENAILSEAYLAQIMGVTTRTVRRMVLRHELPPGIILGGRKSWLAGRVLKWLEKRAEEAEREGEREITRLRSFKI